MEFAIRDICELLVADHGLEVTVLTTNAYTNANFHDRWLPTVPILPDEVQNGVRVRRFPVNTRWTRPLRVAQKLAWELGLPGNDRLRTWYQGPVCPAMLKAVRAEDADVVCAASFPLNHMTYPFRARGSAPIVLIGAIHTDDRWGYERPNLLRLVNRSYVTVAFTDHERSWLLDRGAAPERVRVIGLGIDPNGVRPRPGSARALNGIDAAGYLILYLGQQGGHKGIDTLLAALPRLLARCPDAWLVVAGSRTPYTNVLERLADQLPDPARGRFRLLTDLDPQEKVDLLADCDVFASPSAHESFGLTTLEAWAQSKPVVIGDSPAQRSVAEPDVSAILVRHGDTENLLEALIRLGGDQALRRALGDAGRARLMEHFTLGGVVRRYRDLFEEAAASGASS